MNEELGTTKPWLPCPALPTPAVLTQICHPSTRESEVAESSFPGWPELRGETQLQRQNPGGELELCQSHACSLVVGPISVSLYGPRLVDSVGLLVVSLTPLICSLLPPTLPQDSLMFDAANIILILMLRKAGFL